MEGLSRIDVGFNFLLSPRLPLASETIQAFNEKHPPPSLILNCHGKIMKHTKHQETNKPHISFDINMKSYENNPCEKKTPPVTPPPCCISERDVENGNTYTVRQSWACIILEMSLILPRCGTFYQT